MVGGWLLLQGLLLAVVSCDVGSGCVSLHAQSITGMTSAVESVTFNNSENWIAAGTKSGVIKVFDLDENKSESLSVVMVMLPRPLAL